MSKRLPRTTVGKIAAAKSSIANPFFGDGLAELATTSSSTRPTPRTLLRNEPRRSAKRLPKRIATPPTPPRTFDLIDGTTSCYNELALRSTSEDERLTRSDYQPKKMLEAPKFHYDLVADLKVLQNALKSASFLQDSGYRSQTQLTSSGNYMPSTSTASCQLYTTAWLMADDLSDGDDEENDWDGFMNVQNQKIKVKDLSDILVSRFAFISGLRTSEGHPILTFPDSRSQLSFEEYHLLIAYLFQFPPLDEQPTENNDRGYVIVIDRRTDKWSSVRVLFSYLMNFFPQSVHVVFLLKPEGVLQRALEVGYRNFTENGKFNVVSCQTVAELRQFVGSECLTMDVGGALKYNHLEWVQHRMDIERMKSSAAVIAESLSEFGRALRETELPNDVETTQRILEAQTAERDAIKEDFRISIRKGLGLLRQVRQLEQKPDSEQLSPTRLHNVTAIERMLLQLEDTERSFDSFWSKHQQRLENCLRLRLFEDAFRKLQSNFAKHMIHLEEHRDVGDGVERARELASKHEEYAENAMADVQAARNLHVEGERLMQNGQDVQISDSLEPKCDELKRMAEALTSALDRRAQVLRLSVNMHRQISEATNWCRRGVDLLSHVPLEINANLATTSASRIDEFLADGSKLQLDAFAQMPPNANNLILLTTTETSSLLALVAERIDDIRKLGIARRDALQRLAERDSNKPVQIVSPEKVAKVRHAQPKRQIQVLHDVPSEFAASTSETPQSPTRALAAMELVAQQPLLFQNEPGTSKTTHVLNEMLSTERTYVNELESVIEFYIKPFESPENQQQIPPALRDQTFLVFGNLRQLFEMHSREVLPAFVRFSSSPFQLCRFLINFRDRLLKPYRQFSQNRPLSDSFRAEHQVDECRFFVDCQRRAKHQLPISSYVLQPIQRLGRYPLLLKQLLSFAIEENESEELCQEIQKAFVAMTELITQVNSEMQQLHICGYAENLRMLGPLRLQTECEIFTFKRKSRRLGNKPQKRHLFLFDGGVLFCKRRAQPLPYSSEFYEHKFCIPIASLGFAECSKSAPDRFELWDENKSDGYAVYTTDERARANWINKLAHITVLNAHHQQQHSINKQPRLQHQNSQQQSPTKATSQAQTQSSTSRPHSWTSDSTTVSSRSSTSAFDDASSTTHTECIYTPDSNGNHPNPMDGSHSTCTSISSGSRRSSTTAGSVDDNNSTATPSIHTSKSLQNAAINGARELVRETAVSEV
ncbi:DH domain-containing protein [Aphelenchoides besseyi]|nr:DH domain-containing protein [Aphelenchoides besseyi]